MTSKGTVLVTGAGEIIFDAWTRLANINAPTARGIGSEVGSLLGRSTDLNLLGKAIALRLADDGFDIVVNDISSSAEELTQLVDEIKAKGRTSSAHIADVSVDDQVHGMVDEVVAKYGKLDVMVANAGIATFKSISEMTSEQWDRIMNINARGVFLCYKYAGLQMIKQGNGGRIIGASSILGKQASPANAAYSASKFAVRGLTQAAVPNMLPDGSPRELLISEMEKRSALKTVGHPIDIANLVSFIASKESQFITGQSVKKFLFKPVVADTSFPPQISLILHVNDLARPVNLRSVDDFEFALVFEVREGQGQVAASLCGNGSQQGTEQGKEKSSPLIELRTCPPPLKPPLSMIFSGTQLCCSIGSSGSPPEPWRIPALSTAHWEQRQLRLQVDGEYYAGGRSKDTARRRRTGIDQAFGHCAPGPGRAIALRLANDGFDIVGVVYRLMRQPLDLIRRTSRANSQPVGSHKLLVRIHVSQFEPLLMSITVNAYAPGAIDTEIRNATNVSKLS
ncbi:hypothetical protein C8R47DRAFT_1068784 [Mycena vitilis]|nr:hypothetical protein C8R47DRAFT_1068784 [Mycena vitilis]